MIWHTNALCIHDVHVLYIWILKRRKEKMPHYSCSSTSITKLDKFCKHAPSFPFPIIMSSNLREQDILMICKARIQKLKLPWQPRMTQMHAAVVHFLFTFLSRLHHFHHKWGKGVIPVWLSCVFSTVITNDHDDDVHCTPGQRFTKPS